MYTQLIEVVMFKSPFLAMVADEMYKKHYAKRTIETYLK
jgi:hypothetical protein